MGKASQAKKVNRAAATGGGRTAGKKTPVLWYSSIFVVVVFGVMGVFLASKNLNDTKKTATGVAPVANKDHWHAAYGFNLCGTWAAPLKDGPAGDTTGIHTHEDGLVHTHPFLASVAGKNATFGKLMADTGTTLTATSVDLKREGEKFKNGNKCGKKPGVLTWRAFKNVKDKTGTEMKGDPSTWRIKDGQLISISFNPKGFKLTQPPSAATLPHPVDVGTTPAPSSEQTTPTDATDTTPSSTP